MVTVAIYLLASLQAPMCEPEAARHVNVAAERGRAFNLAGASDAFFTAAGLGCADADVGGHYLRGLVAAREAYRHGGSPESLAPVTQAIAMLDARAGRLPGVAQIARIVLQAAAAAAQSERGEMSLLLEHAVRLEGIQFEAGEPGLPVVTAHETAGDLWLQVHGYDEARRAYLAAAVRVGSTPRIRLGLARVAARQQDQVAACTHYRELSVLWGDRSDAPPEILEARAYIVQPSCRSGRS